MLGAFVVLYLFLGGCGAGVLLCVSAWSLLFYRTRSRTLPQTRAFSALAGRLYAVGFLMLALSCLCLLLDLGRPQRFFLLFLRPTASLLSVGSFLLLASLVCAGLLTASHWLGPRRHGGWARSIAEGLCAALSVALMVYTGLYMAWMEAVPLWNNAALPVLLALSSASSGLAVVFLVAPFSRDSALIGGWERALHGVHRVVLGLEAAALAAFLVLAAANPFAAPALSQLLSPEAGGLWFAVGFAGFGLAAPLAAEALAALVPVRTGMLGAEALCVLGGLILRFCLVLAGSHWLG